MRYLYKHIVMIMMVLIVIIFFFKSEYPLLLFSLLSSSKEEEQDMRLEALEEKAAAWMWGNHSFIDLNGTIMKKMGIHDLYQEDNIYITEDLYIMGAYPETSTDYEYEEIMALKNMLDEKGIRLLYVNEPVKYTDDDWFTEQFHYRTYTNQNADVLLERLTAEGIETLDLRKSLAEDGMNIKDMFYRTDHHWTIESGFWATGKIAEKLNECCGYTIDPDLYEPSRYEYIRWEGCWLGEQGKKVGQAYVGLDDFCAVMPVFEADLAIKTEDGSYAEVPFAFLIDQSVYDPDNDVYDNPSWYYSYHLPLGCRNEEAEHGKLLLLCDSYCYSVEPFLALGIHEIQCVVLRDMEDDFDLKEYIAENEFDTVVICYSQIMIGAHDTSGSANYNMFSFD